MTRDPLKQPVAREAIKEEVEDAVDIGRPIHPRPTPDESIDLAAEVFEGTCTDLPSARKN